MSKYTRQITLGYDKDGNRIRKRVYADTKKQLEQLIIEEKQDFQQSQRIDTTVKFGMYSQKWLETYKSNTSPRTYAMYRRLLDHCSGLDHLQMADIKRSDIQLLINDIYDKPYLCKKVVMTLDQVFKAAMLEEIVVKNPVTKISKPDIIKNEKRNLTKNEKKAILSADFTTIEGLFVMIELNFGLRPGEVLALTKDKFDFDENILLIDSAITYVSNQPILKETKTKKVRLLPIPDRLIPYFEEALESIDGNTIFSYKGGFMTKSAFRHFSDRVFSKINTALGGDKDTDMLNGLTFYTFRHNKATALSEGGSQLSLKARAEYMGHSVDMFLNTYSHVNIAKEDPCKFDLT